MNSHSLLQRNIPCFVAPKNIRHLQDEAKSQAGSQLTGLHFQSNLKSGKV